MIFSEDLLLKKAISEFYKYRGADTSRSFVFSQVFMRSSVAKIFSEETQNWLFTLVILERTVKNLDCHWLLVGARARNDPDNQPD